MEDTHWAVDSTLILKNIKSARSSFAKITNDPELQASRKNALDKEFVRQVKQTDQIAYESNSDAASLKNYVPKEHFRRRNEILSAINLWARCYWCVTVIEASKVEEISSKL